MKERFKNIMRALGYTGAYIGGQIAGGMASAVAIGAYAGYTCRRAGITDAAMIKDKYKELFSSSTGIMVFLAAFITITALAIFFAIRKEKMSEKINLKKTDKKNVLAGAGIGVAMYFVIIGVLSCLPISDGALTSYGEASKGLMNQSVILAILGNIIAAPILEEIIFRGLIFDRLKKAMPVALAVIISSVMFGLAHGQIIWICYATFVGIVLAVIYHKTGSILPSIAAHMLLNGTSTFVSYAGIHIPLAVYISLAAMFILATVVCFIIKKVRDSRRENDTTVKITSVSV